MINLRKNILTGFMSIVLGVAATARAADAVVYQSHAPNRPLPAPSTRPMAGGIAYFVDSAKGSDTADGSAKAPWKTINAAVAHLKPGDTLYLRGGTYYESVTLRINGTKDQPITIRAYPNELAIVDGGIREFFDDPAHAWEPCPDGVAGEYQSVKTYTEFGGNGRFGDSMLPFQRYLTLGDLRSDNELFLPELDNRSVDSKVGIYAGPGTHRDPDTGKIHIRLAHTKLQGLGDDAYTGETDPRKLQIVLAGADYALAIEHGENLRLQDLVIRGGHRTALRIEAATNIDLDGLTVYAGDCAMSVTQTHGLRMTNSALRGFGAPWHSRFIHKDRSKSGYLCTLGGDNFEVANCELTDHHDGIQIYQVDGLKFHHNFVENFNDDGIEPGVRKAHGATYVYCNFISRLLSPFTAHGKKPVQVATDEGSGMFIFRNIIDLREGTYYGPPNKQDPTGAFLKKPTEAMLHDHGSPLQQDYYVYQNTFITNGPAWRDVYAYSWGGRATQTIRRVFNNICFQVDGLPGTAVVVAPEDDFQADGNLMWSLHKGPDFKGDLFAKFRSSKLFEASKVKYPAGWTTNDLFVDPKFMAFKEDYHEPSDFRLQPDSKAIDAGQVLPSNWPDPIRNSDAGKPDIGALPVGVEPWHIGVNGRMSAFGRPIAAGGAH